MTGKIDRQLFHTGKVFFIAVSVGRRWNQKIIACVKKLFEVFSFRIFNPDIDACTKSLLLEFFYDRKRVLQVADLDKHNIEIKCKEIIYVGEGVKYFQMDRLFFTGGIAADLLRHLHAKRDAMYCYSI